jgi:hypothetical protein
MVTLRTRSSLVEFMYPPSGILNIHLASRKKMWPRTQPRALLTSLRNYVFNYLISSVMIAYIERCCMPQATSGCTIHDGTGCKNTKDIILYYRCLIENEDKRLSSTPKLSFTPNCHVCSIRNILSAPRGRDGRQWSRSIY